MGQLKDLSCINTICLFYYHNFNCDFIASLEIVRNIAFFCECHKDVHFFAVFWFNNKHIMT